MKKLRECLYLDRAKRIVELDKSVQRLLDPLQEILCSFKNKCESKFRKKGFIYCTQTDPSQIVQYQITQGKVIEFHNDMKTYDRLVGEDVGMNLNKHMDKIVERYGISYDDILQNHSAYVLNQLDQTDLDEFHWEILKNTREVKKMKNLTKKMVTLGGAVVLATCLWYNAKGETLSFPDYNCTGTGTIVGQQNRDDKVFRAWEDENGDGEADSVATYFTDQKSNCFRVLRRVDPGETEAEALHNDVRAYKDYLDYAKPRTAL